MVSVRRYLRDMSAVVWSDMDLLGMIDASLSDYSRDSGLFRAQGNFLVDEDGSGSYPSDYLSFVAGFNPHGDPLLLSEGWRMDALGVSKGVARVIHDDFESNGRYRLSPNPFREEDVEYYLPQRYGVVLAGDFYGLCPDDGLPGLCDDLVQFNVIGDFQYCRKCLFEEVKDYQAVLYNVLSRAYMMDTDFRDESAAVDFLEMYRSRVNGVQNIVNMDDSVHRGSYF